ncbi:MAG: TetR/AcrR family transcriptional regulator [Deltaproteobacteria bacterium]|nr:TetR/AcrR family transcriptional regulator [Deltaproteobacteria bacterium]
MTSTMRLVKEPKQQRSRETLAYILQATVEVITDSEDGSFSLRAVAERAGISQGTLYARFPTRDELLAYVHHDLWESNRRAVEAWADAEPALAADDRAALERLVRSAIASYADHMRAKRPVVYALSRAMHHAPRLAVRQREESVRQIQRVGDVARRALAGRWTPALAARFELATRIVVGLVRDSSLHGPTDPAIMRLATPELVERLTPIVMGLLVEA